jgi:glycosyltransferase involved in cell wall biosynthesis
MDLSVTIATKNEAANVEECIQAVPFARGIVIADDLNTDDSLERARAFGAKVIRRKSRGSFHENKNLAIQEVSGKRIAFFGELQRRPPRGSSSAQLGPDHFCVLLEARGGSMRPGVISTRFKRGLYDHFLNGTPKFI